MADRIVKIKLDADATGAVRGFASVADAASEAKARMHESARSQRAEWSTVGAGLTAVGVAVTGVGLAALRTGIQYNTLQQTTRAALSTLLGSAQAANAQMDKLDAFARNSPFAKQTFITAQQQMLGFGVAAKDVVPALDAIQNAVAAMGGSNEQIAAISEIMSRIKSESRLSGDALQRLGYYGIDAAAIIGTQMGKTAAEIRDMARKPGGIPVDQVWDPLVTGLQEKFGGAAANVKSTFAGSMDRVKAAWRDFASELARPLVDPNGGGSLVELLNWTADLMRAFEDLPAPVKGTVSALTGIVGVGSLAAGTFMLALPKVLEFRDALKALGGAAGLAKGGLSMLGSIAPQLLLFAAAATAMVAFNKAIEAGKTQQSEFGLALKQTTDLSVALQIATKDTKTNYWTDGFRESLKDLPGLMDRVIYANEEMWGIVGFSDAKAVDNLKQMGTELATIAKTDFSSVQRAFVDLAAGMDEIQVEALLDKMPELRAEFANAADDIGLAASEGNILALAMGDIDYASEKSAQSLEGIAGVASDTTDAIAKLADEIANFGSAQIDADRAAIALEDKIASLGKIVAEGAGSLGVMTDEGRKTEGAMLDLVQAAGKSADAILKSSGSHEDATAVLDRARQTLIDHRVALDDDVTSAAAWADARLAGSESVTQALEGVTAAAEGLPPLKNADVKTDADNATGKLKGTRAAQDALRPNVSTKVTADTSAAIGPLQAIGNWLDRIASGAHAAITTSGGSTGGGAAGGGGSGGASGGRANGGTIGFAQGGTIPGYAGGDTVGFGGGVRNGTVWGQGTAKSDSINVNLSRGEEVIQEPYASLSRPLLKAINRGDFSESMMRPQVIVMPQSASSPLIGGNLQFVSSGNMHTDVGTVTHELRKLSRGGKYVATR